MLSLLFMAKKKKKKSLEETVDLIHKGDTALQNELIDSYKPFIAKTVSSVCKRFIHESDDEFSIGLIAFNEAIQKYSSEKGNSLLSFAEVLIKRRVIDYIRKQSKHQTLSLDLNKEDHEEEVSGNIIEDQLSIKDYVRKTDEEQRRDEILRFSQVLLEYELSFKDLVENSPKHADARRNAMLVASTLVENEQLRDLFMDKKKLPIKQLESLVDVSRKTIERNRKYIIAISLVLMGDYHYLKDYIKGVLET